MLHGEPTGEKRNNAEVANAKDDLLQRCNRRVPLGYPAEENGSHTPFPRDKGYPPSLY